MSRLHILQRIGPNLYEAVIHAPVPDGTNSAGVEWSAAIVAAGLNRTSLPTGKGGLISDEEAAQILAGTVIEGRVQWGVDTGLDVQVATAERAINGAKDGAVAVDQDTGKTLYTAGVDEQLDSVVQAKRGDALNKYIDREIGDLIKETQERLDRFGEVVT